MLQVVFYLYLQVTKTMILIVIYMRRYVVFILCLKVVDTDFLRNIA